MFKQEILSKTGESTENIVRESLRRFKARIYFCDKGIPFIRQVILAE